MATDAQTLLGNAACYECYAANTNSLLLVKLALLRQIVLAANPMADVTPQTLLEQAKCYACYAANPFMAMLLELGLLRQIAGGGAVTAGGGVDCGVTDPVNAPSGTCGIYYRTDNGHVWFWNGAAWVALIE